MLTRRGFVGALAAGIAAIKLPWTKTPAAKPVVAPAAPYVVTTGVHIVNSSDVPQLVRVLLDDQTLFASAIAPHDTAILPGPFIGEVSVPPEHPRSVTVFARSVSGKGHYAITKFAQFGGITDYT